MSKVAVHRLDRDGVVERLRAWATELGRRPEVEEIVLIGSLARGDWSARSDADVVITVSSSDHDLRERSAQYAPARKPGAPVDLFVYTRSERERWGPRFRAAVEAGVPLFTRARTSDPLPG